MSYAKNLDKANNSLFLLGVVFSLVQHYALPWLAMVLKLTSLVLFFAGYTCWTLSGLESPDQKKQLDAWYAFFQFKNQYILSALIGGISIILCVIAFPLKYAIIPAMLLYFMSNIIWCCAEYHRLQVLSGEERKIQKVYLKYSITVTLMSLISTAATLISLCLPVSAPLIAGIALIISIAPTILSIYYLATYYTLKHTRKKEAGNEAESVETESLLANIKESFQKIYQRLLEVIPIEKTAETFTYQAVIHIQDEPAADGISLAKTTCHYKGFSV